MSVHQTLPIVQMGLVEKIAEVAQNHPEVQQQVAQHAARESLRQASRQIQAAEDAEKGQQLRAEEDRGGSGQKFTGNGERRAFPQEDEDAPPSPADPWSGNILNVKV